MKLKQYIYFIVFILGGYALSGCSDSNSLVGSGIQPEDDFITIYRDTFQVKSSTVKIDSLYAKTTSGLLGEYYDPLYGHLKSDYLCQFYCKEGYRFSRTPYEGKIDSVSLYIYYTYTGDPKAAMQIQVYPLTKPLDKDYYTNINPEEYCDMQNPLGYTVCTPSNGFIVEDSSSTTPKTIYLLEIRLPPELGQKFYDETVNNPASFASQTAFNQFFPGVYVTSDYGNGWILELPNEDHTTISIAYNYALKDTAGNDSLVVSYEHFTSTKEVIQLNRVTSSNDEPLLAENNDYTYLKTPAGIFTRLVFPAKEVAGIVEGRIFNSLGFSLKYMPQEDWIYSLAPPPQLLLMPEDSLANYFKKTNVENNITTFLSYHPSYSTGYPNGYDPSTRTYYFGNIVNMLNYHIKQNPEEDLRVLVVPVSRESYNNSNSGYNYQTLNLSHYMGPAGVKLRKDTESMQVILTTSKYLK